MLIKDKVDAVYIPDDPSRIKADDYNQIKNEIQECITSAGMTPQKDVIQLPDALKILTAQSGAEEMEKISAAGENQLSLIKSAGDAQAERVNSQGSEYAELAKNWANKTDGPVEDGEYSAKKYAQDAAQNAQNSRGLAVGTVYFSQSAAEADNPGALPLFTGETIANFDEIYPDFYAWLTAHTGLICTPAEYEAALAQFGECARYGVSDTSVRLPLIKNYVKAAGTEDGVKNIEAGLPNITGSISYDVWANNAEGAFYDDGGSKRGGMSNDVSSKGGKKSFDASRSSEIYGKSATVTPASTTLYPWVVAFNAAVEASVAQAAEFQQALSGKADTNFGNVADNIDYVIDSYSDENGNWYRLYKSGWLEQGGVVAVNYTNTAVLVSLLKPFANTNYNILLTMGNKLVNGVGNCSYESKTTTSFNIYGDYTNSTANNVPTTWYACGQAAS